jgi:hypothetical protein
MAAKKRKRHRLDEPETKGLTADYGKQNNEGQNYGSPSVKPSRRLGDQVSEGIQQPMSPMILSADDSVFPWLPIGLMRMLAVNSLS